MVQAKVIRSFSFLWSTIIGGIFFLLPMIAILALLGQIYGIVAAIAVPLHDYIPVNSALGIGLLFLAAIVVVILICCVAGVLARRAIGQRFAGRLEKQVSTLFPKYSVYKDLLAGNLNHDHGGPALKPILLTMPEGERIAFEADSLNDDTVVVYLPGSPDAWIGSVVLVPRSRIRPASITFNDTVGILEQLGRNSRQFLGSIDRQVVKQ